MRSEEKKKERQKYNNETSRLFQIRLYRAKDSDVIDMIENARDGMAELVRKSVRYYVAQNPNAVYTDEERKQIEIEAAQAGMSTVDYLTSQRNSASGRNLGSTRRKWRQSNGESE